MKKILLILLCIISTLLFGECGNSFTSEPSSIQSSENQEISMGSSDNFLSKKAENFIENFSEDYPDFVLLDYAEGHSENYPIILVAVAQNLIDNTSSTLFILDDNGIGQLVLASDSFGVYRTNDDLKLSKNKILLSIDIQNNETTSSDSTDEYKVPKSIHDFEITVTQIELDGVINTVYSSNETIRSD